MIQILFTDRDLNVIGDPLTSWTSLDVTRRFNEPASGTVHAPAYPGLMASLQPGNRVIVIRDGAVWCQGPLEIPQDFVWSVGDEGEPGPGMVEFNFSDDLAVVAGYITWPLPLTAWTGQPDSHKTGTRNFTATNAESVIRSLVDETCGPGAQVARQVPHLALAPLASVGTAVSISTRFEGLLETCRRAAVNGGGLGFRTHVSAGQILFEVYAPVDRTFTARFSKGLGNLRSVRFKQSAPTVTHALVSGSWTEATDTEPATDRIYVEAADAAAATSWWRVEKHVSGSEENDVNGELTDAGATVLDEGAAPVELATVTIDTEDLRAGRDYDLGDRVTIELPTGLEVSDLVRSIHLQATPNSGEYVSALVGSSAATTAPESVRLIRELGRRIGRMETRKS